VEAGLCGVVNADAVSVDEFYDVVYTQPLHAIDRHSRFYVNEKGPRRSTFRTLQLHGTRHYNGSSTTGALTSTQNTARVERSFYKQTSGHFSPSLKPQSPAHMTAVLGSPGLGAGGEDVLRGGAGEVPRLADPTRVKVAEENAAYRGLPSRFRKKPNMKVGNAHRDCCVGCTKMLKKLRLHL